MKETIKEEKKKARFNHTNTAREAWVCFGGETVQAASLLPEALGGGSRRGVKKSIPAGVGGL